MSSSLQLTITPLKYPELPSDDVVIAAANDVLAAIPSWKQGKSFEHGAVKTFSRPKAVGDGASWHARVSEHSSEDATFDEFWSKLGEDKAENEKQYIHDIHKVTLIRNISATQNIWTLQYKFPPPVSPRIFTVVQITRLEQTSPRRGIVVSIPVDLSGEAKLANMEEKGVRGRYVSVESIKELDSGKVEWTMATSSTPGGNIPQFVAERTMPGKISEDVPLFLKWLHTVREKPTPTADEPVAAPSATTTAEPAAAPSA